jgi:hypothetical protein
LISGQGYNIYYIKGVYYAEDNYILARRPGQPYENNHPSQKKKPGGQRAAREGDPETRRSPP